MRRGTFLVLASAMTIVALLVRIDNALTFPVLGGYDAFAHFTYIWFLDVTGRIPLADAGWEFFQPPLYYALMTAIWKAFGGFDPELRLRIGTALIAMLGLVQAGVAFAMVRRRFPGERLIQLLTAGVMLFLPVHLYSAGFLGNEGLTAVLCSLALLLLLWTLQRPTPARSASLGLCLGLAMLTKYTAVVVVAAALATIALRGLAGREPRVAARTLATVTVVLLVVCGWYYARNVSVYGTPFRLSREELFLERVEDSQLQGRREFLEYVLFDPGIVYRPQWPRGLSLNSPRPPGAQYSPLRESIPTGLFANAWFDGFGGVVLPPVTHSEASRRAGQLLLLLALVPTSVMLLGILAALRSLRRSGWDDATVATLLSVAAMAAVVVHGTRTVPTQAAVKATYLMPVSVAFAFLFALGLHCLARRSPRSLRGVAIVCGVLFLVSPVVFTHRRVSGDDWFVAGLENSTGTNMRGVLQVAGGERAHASALFEAAARSGLHLGYENLAAMAFERGDHGAARWFLSAAALRQPGQTRGTPDQRRRAIASTQAEYANTLAVILEADGSTDDAMRAVETSLRHDPSIPEASYNLGVLELLRALELPAGARGATLERARAAFARSVELDPEFREARAMTGVASALGGDCAAAVPVLSRTTAPQPPAARAYPVETGPGDLHAAGLLRRRRIETLPPELSPQRQLRQCSRG